MTAPANLPSDVYAHPRCVQLGVPPYLTASTIRERVNANNGWAVGLFTCPACHQTHAHVVPDRPAVELQAPAAELEQSRGTSRPLSPKDDAPNKARALIARGKAAGLGATALTGERWVGVRLVHPGTAVGWVATWTLVEKRDRLWPRPPKPKGDPGLMVGPEGDLGMPYDAWVSDRRYALDGERRHAITDRELDAAVKALGTLL